MLYEFEKREITNKAILSVITYFVINWIVAIPVVLILTILITDMDKLLLISNFIIYIIAFTVLTLINKDMLVKMFKNKIGKKGDLIKYSLFGILVIYIANISTSLLYEFGFKITDNSLNQEALIGAVDAGSLFFSFFFIVLLGPIVEEIVFRHSFIHLFRKKMNPYAAMMLSSFIFGLIHVISGGDFVFLPLYMLLGVVIGYFYVKFNYNLPLAIIIHIGNNLLSYIAIILL